MKTVMSGQRIPFRNRIDSALSIYRAHRDRIFSNADAAISYHKVLLGYLDRYVGLPVNRVRILDVGCGQTATQTALFHTDGANVIGIDIEVPTYRMSLPIFSRIIRLNGIERAVKSLLRHIMFDKSFFAELSKEYGKTVSFDDVDTRIMDTTSMEFDSASFDFVFSHAVFEHINDVPAAVKEVNRVLGPSGIAVISIDLFPSLSGGHSLEWICSDQSPSTRVLPWDHLLDNKYPANTYLNKLRVNQYRDIFRSYTDVVEEQTSIEGERLLTSEIESELTSKGYTREDLLTRTVTFIAKKRAH